MGIVKRFFLINGLSCGSNKIENLPNNWTWIVKINKYKQHNLN